MANDYDKFAKARQEELLNGTKKPHRYVEKPMMFSMLPNLSGKKVLMLGCGTGEETKILYFDSTELVGIDLSETSIEIAKKTYPQYEFLVGDMHKLPFKDNSFDFVYSSLVVHYSDNPEMVYKEIYRILKDDGQFLFSVGHPLRWSSEKATLGNIPVRLIGYTDEYDGRQVVYGNYHTFAPHEHHFPNNEVLRFYVGSPSMHFKLLRKCGFLVEDFTESKCVEEAKEVDIDYFNRFSEIPQFMAFLVRKERKQF